MRVAGVAFGLFALAFALHWLWWRVRVPKRQSAAIMLLFFGVLAAGLGALHVVPGLKDRGPWGLWPSLHIAIFHTAVTLAYVVAYSILEERSPSMTLLVHVADAGSRGRSRDELLAVMSGFTPVETRLTAMVRDGMIAPDGDGYLLTPKGRVWAVTFGTWHRLIRLQKGG
jgi:hypothetical protein